MSETEPRSPAMQLHAAAQLASFPAQDGWPECLTPGQLANLQYPNEGTLLEKQTANSSRSVFLGVVRAAIDAGVVETVAIEARASGRHGATTHRALNGLASSEWLERDFAAAATRPVETSFKAVRGITPKACAAWFHATKEIPRSDYVRAWLGAEWSESAPKLNPPKVGTGDTATVVDQSGDPYDWKAEACRLADIVGCKKLKDDGIQQINPNSVCEAVATALGKDSRSHGKFGPLSAGFIRTIALKHWKFDRDRCKD